MGQEQSSNSSASSRGAIPGGGVQLVHGARASSNSKDHVDLLLEKSAALRLPQPLLPPPAIKDDVTSALQGAQVMHELRTVLGGLLLGGEDRAPPQGQSKVKEGEKKEDEEREGSAAFVGAREIGDELQRRTASIDEVSKVSELDTRAEQEQWARLGIDYASVKAVLEECTGGDKLESVLDRQALLMRAIGDAKEKAARLKRVIDRNGEEAKRTTKALEKLDRIHVALADVQDHLEAAVATANILGASHFADDEEMCSFKNFLKHNPPNIL